jgi:hypothetical protein
MMAQRDQFESAIIAMSYFFISVCYTLFVIVNCYFTICRLPASTYGAP